MRKILSTAILLASSGVTQAQLCDTSSIDGLHFELTRPSAAHAFSSYRSTDLSGHQIGWVKAFTSRERYDVESQAGRQGVFVGNSFYRRPEHIDGHAVMVRYYTAMLDNCDQVHLRIPEEGAVAQNREIPPPKPYDEGVEYLRKRSADMGARVPMNTQVLSSLVGEPLVMLPINDDYMREPWVYRQADIHRPEVKALPSNNKAQSVRILEVIESPFLWRGRQLAPTTLKVDLEGVDALVYIPGYWDELIAFEGSVVPEEVVRGLSKEGLLIAKGRPERVETRTWVELSDDTYEVWLYPNNAETMLVWMLDDHVRKVIIR